MFLWNAMYDNLVYICYVAVCFISFMSVRITEKMNWSEECQTDYEL